MLTNFVTFAQPEKNDEIGGLEDPKPAASIGWYVWVLAAIVLVYFFWEIVFTTKKKCKVLKKNSIQRGTIFKI